MALSRLFRIIPFAMLAALILLSPVPATLLNLPASIADPTSNTLVPSWNPAVTCKAQVLTVEQFIGTVANPKETRPRLGADYSGGALQLVGKVPAGSIAPSSSWPYSKRWLPDRLPCTARNADGAMVPTLVEIHGVTVVGAAPLGSECGSVFRNPDICDLTFHVCNAVLAPNCSEGYPDSMHVFHVEIDMYWIHSQISPSFPPAGSTIDIQGFAFWDDAHLIEGWHSYSGWELHPLTAWRPAVGDQVLGASFDYTPPVPSVGDSIGFTGNAIGGTSPYSYGWNFGDGNSTNGISVFHSFTTAGYHNVTLNVADSKGFRSTTSRLLTIQDPPDFQLSSESSKLLIFGGSSNTTTITVSSLNSFTGRLTLSAQVPSDNITIQLSPADFTLQRAGSRIVTMKAVIKANTEPGSYPVRLEASSNGATRAVIITLDIPSFDVSVDSSSLEIAPGSIGSFLVTLRSLGGFSDAVTISSTSNLGLGLSLDPSIVQLSADASANTTLTVNPSTSGIYNIVLTATNGIVHQQLPLSVNVYNGADFVITPSSLIVLADPGTSQVTTVTVTSLDGFSGDVNLTVESDPPGAVVIAPSRVALTGGTTVPVLVTISTRAASAREFSITITGDSGIIRHTSRIMVNVSSPSDSTIYWEAGAIGGGIGAILVVKTAWSRSHRSKIDS